MNRGWNELSIPEVTVSELCTLAQSMGGTDSISVAQYTQALTSIAGLYERERLAHTEDFFVSPAVTRAQILVEIGRAVGGRAARHSSTILGSLVAALRQLVATRGLRMFRLSGFGVFQHSAGGIYELVVEPSIPKAVAGP